MSEFIIRLYIKFTIRENKGVRVLGRKELGDNIKNIRESKGITQIFLAKKLGYASSSSLSEIENGKKGLDACKIPDLANALGVKIEDIFRVK